jgi:hypothetical protein
MVKWLLGKDPNREKTCLHICLFVFLRRTGFFFFFNIGVGFVYSFTSKEGRNPLVFGQSSFAFDTNNTFV